jgi:hypothetical protein
MGLITLAAASTLAGCMVSARPIPAAQPVAYTYETYEQPVYHDGLLVHFDTAGFPFIYVGSVPRYVPHHHPRFPYLMQRSPRHWRSPGYARNTSYGGHGRYDRDGRDGRYDRGGRHDRDGGNGRWPRSGRY